MYIFVRRLYKIDKLGIISLFSLSLSHTHARARALKQASSIFQITYSNKTSRLINYIIPYINHHLPIAMHLQPAWYCTRAITQIFSQLYIPACHNRHVLIYRY